MVPASKAGAVYALIVFLIGFALGTIRVLLIVPRLGESAAVLLETPFMLAASWFVCRWCVDWLDVPRRIGPRCLMGGVAFVVLMTAEFVLGRLVLGRSLTEQLAGYASTAGVISLVAPGCLRRISGHADLEARAGELTNHSRQHRPKLLLSPSPASFLGPSSK